MKILLLSPNALLLPAFQDDDVTPSMASPEHWPEVDWVVSFGYRYLIGKVTLAHYPGRVINVHIGMLPFNRGADPNFWSYFDNTPKGSTVHLIDEGIDTGPMFDQCEMNFTNPDHTLKTSYEALVNSAALHFKTIWPDIRDGKLQPKKQPEGGSYHNSQDKDIYMKKLKSGWDTPVSGVEELGRRSRGQTE